MQSVQEAVLERGVLGEQSDGPVIEVHDRADQRLRKAKATVSGSREGHRHFRFPPGTEMSRSCSILNSSGYHFLLMAPPIAPQFEARRCLLNPGRFNMHTAAV